MAPELSVVTWIGIVACVVQSAIFSGLNLAIFSLSKLRLEVEVINKNARAIAVLELRKDANLLLATLLWGNVAVNVLLTLLCASLLAGFAAFFFSTFIITLLCEIVPQAYFSRNALRTAAYFAPMLKIYQIGLFPIAKPTALFLNWWLGHEDITVFVRSLPSILKWQERKSADWRGLVRSIFWILMTSLSLRRANRSIRAASSHCLQIKEGLCCQGSRVLRTILSCGSSMPQVRNGSSSPTWKIDRNSCLTLITSSGMRSSTRSQSDRTRIGIVQLSSPTCKRGWET
jgi:cyclin M-like protein